MKEKMMMKFVRGIFAFILVILLCAMPAMAIDPIPDESGFSGFISVGTSYTNMKSNTIAGNSFADVGNEIITSVNDGPSSNDEFGLALNFELKYTFAGSGTQLFLGNELEDLLRYDLASQAGVRQKLGGMGIGSISYVFSGIPTEVWEDPFLENSPRVDTDRDSNGVRLAWDTIFGSAFQVQYTYRKIDIDREQSGVGLGLTAAQQALLNRDGDKHDMELLYRFSGGNPESGVHIFYPSLTYTFDDRDGNAIKEDGFRLLLSYAFDTPKYTFVLNGSIGTYESDQANPVFNKTLESDRYSISAIAFWKKPFGWELGFGNSWSLYLNAIYGEEDANISFYDAEIFMAGTGVIFYF